MSNNSKNEHDATANSIQRQTTSRTPIQKMVNNLDQRHGAVLGWFLFTAGYFYGAGRWMGEIPHHDLALVYLVIGIGMGVGMSNTVTVMFSND